MKFKKNIHSILMEVQFMHKYERKGSLSPEHAGASSILSERKDGYFTHEVMAYFVDISGNKINLTKGNFDSKYEIDSDVLTDAKIRLCHIIRKLIPDIIMFTKLASGKFFPITEDSLCFLQKQEEGRREKEKILACIDLLEMLN